MSTNRLDLYGRWSEHPSIDYILAALALTAHILVVHRTGHGDLLMWVQSSQRQALYACGAGVVAIIGGLAAVALAIYQALSGARSQAVRDLYGEAVRRNWRSLLVVTGLSATLCLVALATDREHDPLSSRFIFEGAMAVGAARFGRLLWLFDAFLKVNDREASDRARPAAPPVDSRWTNLQGV